MPSLAAFIIFLEISMAVFSLIIMFNQLCSLLWRSPPPRLSSPQLLSPPVHLAHCCQEGPLWRRQAHSYLSFDLNNPKPQNIDYWCFSLPNTLSLGELLSDPWPASSYPLLKASCPLTYWLAGSSFSFTLNNASWRSTKTALQDLYTLGLLIVSGSFMPLIKFCDDVIINVFIFSGGEQEEK